MLPNKPSPIDQAWSTRVTTFFRGAEAAAIMIRAQCQAPERARGVLLADDERFQPYRPERDGHFADEHKWFGAVDEPIEPGDQETCGEWRLRQWREYDAHVRAWRESAPFQYRPFRFEDLNGKPEPESWGPCYPKTASAAVEKWRRIERARELTADEKREYGRAVGEWIRNLNAIKPAPRVALKYVMPDYAAKARAAVAAAAAADRRAWAFGGAKSNSVGLMGLTIEQAYARAMADKRARLEAKPVAPVTRLNEQEPAEPAKPARRPRKLKAAA